MLSRAKQEWSCNVSIPPVDGAKVLQLSITATPKPLEIFFGGCGCGKEKSNVTKYVA